MAPQDAADLGVFAERLQQAVDASAPLDPVVMAGALVGAGIELGLRNGVTAAQLRAHFEIVVGKIRATIVMRS